MKNSKSTLLTILMLVLSIGVFAQQPKTSQVKFFAADKAQRSQILGLLEIDHFNVQADGGIVSVVNQRMLKKLAGTGVRYEVLIDDMAKKIADVNRQQAEDMAAGRSAFDRSGSTVATIVPQPAAFVLPGTFGGYWSYAQMVTLMNTLVANYPTIAQKFTIGTTHEGRDIWVIKISDNVATDESEPEVLFMGLQHAREAITGSSMIFLMQHLCERYTAGDTKVMNLVQNREIFIIPCFNADGWEYNRTSMGNAPGGDWRKNRRPQVGDVGVDLNRNWGIDWGNCPMPAGSCGSNSTSSDLYWGTSAFSEPETQAVRNWVYTRQFTAMIDQHAYGPYYSLPFGRPTLHSMSTDDQNFYTRIPALMGTYNSMRAGNSLESVGYEVAGGVKDWMLMGNIGTGTKGKIYGMTGEGGAAGGNPAFNPTGMENFWPLNTQIVRLCQGMVYQDLQLALAAGSYVDVQDQGNLSVAAKWGTFDFSVRRIGVGNSPITVTLVPLENVVTVGAPVVINSIPAYYGTSSGSINYTLPWTMTNEQRFRYIWRVTSGGITFDDTVTKFYNPQVLFSDNMEGTSDGTFATNWAVTGGGWNYATDAAVQGARSLHESPGGLYSASQTRTATRSTVLNLSNATQAYLSVWVRHRAENARDKLQLQVSINNGAAWPVGNVAVGTHTVQEANDLDGSTLAGRAALTGIRDIWQRVTYNLTPYIGNAQVRVRFVFTSDANSTGFDYQVDDGFFLDNMQMVKSTIPMAILPVKFLDVRAKMLPNRTAEVYWEAETDSEHDYFEVERSANSSDFKAIGKVTTVGSPYKFIDNAPLSGTNYYRIKQYDKNGNINYSPVVKVSNIHLGGLQVYPNPLTESDVLTIRPETNFTQPVNVRITDAQGRMVFQKFIHEWPASKEIQINTTSWTPQVYILKMTNSRGEFITVEKIMKK